MTLNREQNVVAWHAHRLEHGRILSVASLRGSRNTPDEEVWFAVARGEGGGGLHYGGMHGGWECLPGCLHGGCREGETLSGLSHLAGCSAFLVGGDGACMDISVDGAGNAACPGRGMGKQYP